MYLGRELHPFFLLYHTTIPKSFESLDMRVREREAWGKYERKKGKIIVRIRDIGTKDYFFYIFYYTSEISLILFRFTSDIEKKGWRMEKYKGGRNSM